MLCDLILRYLEIYLFVLELCHSVHEPRLFCLRRQSELPKLVAFEITFTSLTRRFKILRLCLLDGADLVSYFVGS